MFIFQNFDSMCRKIVCPTRHSQINQHEIIARKFRNNQVKFDVTTIINDRKQKLSVLTMANDFQNLPTILYLHGNGGHKMQSLQIYRPQINLISFDFAGCGKSQGDFLTYGDNQVKDIHTVVKEIKRRYGVEKLVLWGRSMGASFAIMYASYNPKSILSMILDTPFRTLRQTIKNVAYHKNMNFPNFTIDIVLGFVESKLTELTSINVFKNDFQMHLNLIQNIPVMFVYSTHDIVVKEENVKEFYDSFKGLKVLLKIQSEHHQDRPKKAIQQSIKFVREHYEKKIYSSFIKPEFDKKIGIGLSIRNKK